MIPKIQKRGKTSGWLSLISVFLFLFFVFPLVDASLLPFEVTKQTTSKATTNLSSQIVHFQRFVQINNNSEKLIFDTSNEEIFLIEKDFEEPLKLRCSATLDNFFQNFNSSNLETSWILDDGTVLSPTEFVEVSKPSKEFKIRCQARLSNVSGLPNGTVLSRSVQFRRKKPCLFEIEPRVFHAMPKSGVRLVCRWPLEIAESVVWKLNGKELQQTKNVKFGGTRGKSVLHILRANSENAGEYRCLPSNTTEDLKDQPSEVVIDETAPEWPGVELPDVSFGPIGGEEILECFSPGSRGYRWTLERPRPPEKNETLPRLETKFLSNSSILVLKNISKEMSGIIRCTIEYMNGSLKAATTEFKALDSFVFDFGKTSLARVTKKQGIAMNFRCETYDLLGETPEMATWYVNSKPVEKSPYVKIVKTEQQVIGYADLLIGIAEKEFSGIYSCIVSNKRQERIKQLIFSVDVTTNETLSNLEVTTDHEEKCIRLEFDLPESTELSWAHFTTYFVVVYKANDTESLNSLPSMAKCNYKGHCNIELCSETTELEESTEYVFRISMVLSGAGTVITPLSAPTKALTWDGPARKSLPLNMIFLEDENALEIQWKKPSKDVLPGRVVSYVVQLANYSDKMTNLLAPVQREYYERDVFNRNFRIENVTKPFAFKFRVTPMTRSRKLPLMNMPLIEFFPFLLFTSSDDGHALADSMIPAPEISASQMNLLPIVVVKWNKPENEFNKIIFRYQHVLNSRSKFIVVERPAEEERMELTRGIEPGFVYQICAAFVRKEDKAHGTWNCLAIPVKNQYNNLAFSNEKDAVKKSQLASPINCEKSNCRCLPSNSGSIRVEWDEHETGPDKSKVDYIVHYTLDETDPNSENIQMPVSIGDSFVDLISLFPNTTYRIMIESINELGDSVVGTWFSCKTPSELSIPPPKHFGYTLLNATHVELHWVPLDLGEDESLIDGYTLFWQREGIREKSIFIPDATRESYILSSLRPSKNYHISISSHSPITGNSKQRSEHLMVTLPALPVMSDEESNEKTTVSSLHSDDLMFRIALISAVTTVSLFLLLLTVTCCYFCCFLRLRRWRQEREQQRILRMRSNASSALSLKSEEDREIGQMSSTREMLPLLQLPPDPPGFNEDPYRNDTKGPAGGPRPLGNKRFLKMMQDPDFLQRIAEMNRDPTGLGEGVSACSRDKYLMELHKEEDRIVREISARQRAAVAKRRKEFEEKKKLEEEKKLNENKKMKENDRNVETLSVGHLKLNRASLHETSSLSRLKQNVQNLASHSLTELNKSSKGLSNRSFSVSFYQKIFPRKRPSFLSSLSKLAESKTGEMPLLSSPSNGSNQLENHPPASSLPNLPNLTDSGIFCFDDGSNGSNFGRTCDRSGSATLVDEASTPMADKSFFVNLNGFRQHLIDRRTLLP